MEKIIINKKLSYFNEWKFAFEDGSNALFEAEGDCCAGVTLRVDTINDTPEQEWFKKGLMILEISKIEGFGIELLTENGPVRFATDYYDGSGWGGYWTQWTLKYKTETLSGNGY